MKSVLIVEDDAIVALDLKSRIEKLGYKVIGSVASGQEALNKITETRPDLVIMDIVLRGKMDGIEVAEKIKDLKIPIVFLTAYSDPETIKRARKAGAYGYLLKPYDDNSLKVAIKTALKRYEADIRDLLKAPSPDVTEVAETPNILLVEDDAIIAADFEEKLKDAGFNVVGVEVTGEQAVKTASKLKPDVVIMDVVLKGKMDGIKAAKIIQGDYDIPVIYLTAYSDDKTLSRILESEPYGYLVKPCNIEQLKAEIQVVLETFHETKEYSKRMHDITVTKAEEMKIEKTAVFFVSSIIISLAIYGFISRDMTWLMYVLFIPVSYSLLYFVSSFKKPNRPSNGEMPMVSILVPAHNEENTIRECVESLSRLDYHLNGSRNYEIIVINDGSTDGTGAILKELVKEHKHLHVVTRKAPFAFNGKGYALNDGLTLANGDIIAVFDADARVRPDFLKKIIPYFEGENVAGVQSRVRMYNADKNLLTKMQDIEFAIFGNLIMRSRMNMGVSAFLGGNGQLVRKDIIKEVGGWDGYAATEDLNLTVKLMLKGYYVRYCPEAEVWLEAVPEWPAFFKQRTRWLTGNLETLFVYLPPVIDAPIPIRMKIDSIFYLFSLLFIGFVMLGYIVFILNIGGFTMGMRAPFIIGLISTIAFFPLTITGIKRDGYSIPRSIILSIEYWAYCLYLLPLFLIATAHIIRRSEKRWAKTRHIGN
ncbi:MAG: response regulator [Methanobacteriaceae archaeon]|nr:response regulator [Methanobacteriaceae archaeon]